MLKAAAAVRPGVEESALARARQGDPAAFADIVRSHQAMVFSLALHFVGDRPSAEDLAQEVFLRLYQHLDRIETPVHLLLWLRRVTSRCCIDWSRRCPRADHVPLEDRQIADGLEPTVRAASRDIWLEERLRALMIELPAAGRLVLTLRYQEDLDPSEIARVLDMPLNTVKSHLRRSVEHLRARLRMETKTS